MANIAVALFIIRFLLYMGTTTGHSLKLNGLVSPKVQCIESEREALLRFKQGFTNPSGLFSSWVVGVGDNDCCQWRGVGCNNSTGHVTTLDISSQHQTVISQGEFLSASLLDLPYLSYLDLSQNDFRQIQIPESIGSIASLEHVDLSNANFRGTIPDHLGNLSRLQSLDLSGNSNSLQTNNLNWLRGLSSLLVLDLGGVDLSRVADWLDAINMLPSLVELNLFACKLKILRPTLPYVNFTKLELVDLSLNSFNSIMPSWLFNISHSLVSLHLSRSQLQGLIPNTFENMTSLVFLDLSENSFEGEIPTTLGLIPAENQVKTSSWLRELYLSHNKLNGSLEQSLQQFSQLVVLDVASNSLEGVISENHLLNFSSLRALDLSSNLLTLNISSGWIPPFQLDTIGLRSCQLGPRFPEWLRSQKDFLSLDISNASISDTVPHWFWTLSNKVQHLNLYSNQLRGKVPNFSSKLNLSTLDLSSNNLEGPLPQFSPNMVSLVLAGNSFSGGISSLCEMLVPNSTLSYLDLSGNLLSGEIPDCWTYGQMLVILSLANNNLSGKIPNSIGHLVHLNTLHLENNSITGELPLSLKNCTSLFVLDVGHNKLSGNIPAWIGEEMQNLMILRLCANAFEENIPLQICQLKSLKILDLAFNYLSGSIPRCMNNLLDMGKLELDRSYIFYPYTTYRESVHLTSKSHDLIYSVTLVYVKLLDLSSNNLSGDIPREMESLIGLLFLNLSRNHLTGTIPDGIGYLESLESLDLSRNELSCTIPASLSNLSFLSHLDLSYNRLSGKIPSGNQLLTLDDPAIYLGNHNLCGSPLANDCLINGIYEDPNCKNKERNEGSEGTEEDEFHVPSLYISMGLGFVTGFWGFWGTLLIKSSWRHAYYRFLVNLYDKIYVIIVVYVNRLAKKFENNHVSE